MASIIPKTKDGKIISYKFKACVGRDDCGKQVFRCMTWKVPVGLGPAKAEKAAEKLELDRTFEPKGVDYTECYERYLSYDKILNI